jgi:hypothetical protein
MARVAGGFEPSDLNRARAKGSGYSECVMKKAERKARPSLSRLLLRTVGYGVMTTWPSAWAPVDVVIVTVTVIGPLFAGYVRV